MKQNKNHCFLDYFNLAMVLGLLLAASLHASLSFTMDNKTQGSIQALFRSYYLNDQRLQWSGQEATFGVESVLDVAISRKIGASVLNVSSQLFFNQPFDRNMLIDEARVRYLQNFDISAVEIKKLMVEATMGAFHLGLGKKDTIFGRHYFRSCSNSLADYPFIRTEALVNYETGLYFGFHGGLFVCDVAVTNGCENMDTNSSKAGIVRLALQSPDDKWTLGFSAKYQDGIGSESQKEYKNHVGFDTMIKCGAWRLFSEIIYDEYGFHRQFPEDGVFWKRSYYYRDIFYQTKIPINGVGGYLALQFQDLQGRWFMEAHYGQYYPKKIGHPYHDDPIHRMVIKGVYSLDAHFNGYAFFLKENQRRKEPLFKGASDFAYAVGIQYSL